MRIAAVVETVVIVDGQATYCHFILHVTSFVHTAFFLNADIYGDEVTVDERHGEWWFQCVIPSKW